MAIGVFIFLEIERYLHYRLQRRHIGSLADPSRSLSTHLEAIELCARKPALGVGFCRAVAENCGLLKKDGTVINEMVILDLPMRQFVAVISLLAIVWNGRNEALARSVAIAFRFGQWQSDYGRLLLIESPRPEVRTFINRVRTLYCRLGSP